jgi:hypothetical protein
MGIRSLYLGLVDEGGMLRNTRRLATGSLPRAASATGDAEWDPEENMRWAARVLGALRDYFQEAADLAAVVSKHQYTPDAVWRVEISPVGGEVRLLVRALGSDERRRIVPKAVLKALEKGYS